MRSLDSLAAGETYRVTITLHPNGALQIEGPIYDRQWTVALLQNAIDAVRNQGRREFVIPAHDVDVPPLGEFR